MTLTKYILIALLLLPCVGIAQVDTITDTLVQCMGLSSGQPNDCNCLGWILGDSDKNIIKISEWQWMLSHKEFLWGRNDSNEYHYSPLIWEKSYGEGARIPGGSEILEAKMYGINRWDNTTLDESIFTIKVYKGGNVPYLKSWNDSGPAEWRVWTLTTDSVIDTLPYAEYDFPDTTFIADISIPLQEAVNDGWKRSYRIGTDIYVQNDFDIPETAVMQFNGWPNFGMADGDTVGQWAPYIILKYIPGPNLKMINGGKVVGGIKLK